MVRLTRTIEDRGDQVTAFVRYCMDCMITAFGISMEWTKRIVGYLCITIGCIAMFPLMVCLGVAFVVFELSHDE